jgi:ElaB/YqjD/DUF883 family membrane-anchored ribosome-binding protein
MDIKSPTDVLFPDGTGLPDGLVHEAAASAHGAVDRVAQVGHQTIDKMTDTAGPPVEWMNQAKASIQSAPANALAGARQYVTAYPLRSIGMALAAGFLIARWRHQSTS